MRTIRNLAVVAFVALSLAPAGAASAQASTASRMVAEINAARTAHGLRPFVMSQRINRSSYRWARHLMRRDVLAHGSLRAARVKGEVIEKHGGRRSRVARTVRAWLSSPAHRAILLSARFRRIGVGKSTGRFGGRRATIWVGRFR